jgi:hypothetical protein
LLQAAAVVQVEVLLQTLPLAVVLAGRQLSG